MDAFGCDYECRTVGEGLAKYKIADDWCAEFDAHDVAGPVVCIQVEQVRKYPELMDLPLCAVENADDVYAACMVLTEKKTIVFKIESLGVWIQAMRME